MNNFVKLILIILLITGCQSLNNFGNNIGSTIGFIEEDPFAPTKIQTNYSNFLESNWVKRNTNSFKFSELGKKRPAKNLFFASSGDRLFSIFDNLEVIDINSGETLNEVFINESVMSGVAAGYGVFVYVGENGEIFVNNIESGENRWSIKLNDQVLSPALITSRYILIQTSSDVLYVFNLSDGETVWSKKAQPSILSIRGTSTPMLYEGLVFTSFSNGRLSANRITDGIQLWERPISVIKGSTELEKLKDSDSQAIAFEESVYAANFNGSLTRFNIRDGEKVFSVDLSTSKPLLMWRDTLLSANTDDEIIQFDALNGSEKWRNSSFKYRKLSNLVVHNGNLLFGDYEGYVHKLNLQNGEILGISKSKLNSIKNIAVISNDLIIQDDFGSIEVLSIF